MLRRGFSLLFILLGLAALASADSRARIVRLSYIEGDVELDRRDGRGFQKAFLNMPVIDDARLWTQGNGRAEVEFEDGSTLRLVPNTIIEFRELGRRGDGDLVTHIDIQEGMLYGNVKHHSDDEFRVMFGQEQMTLEKSSRFRLGVSHADTKLAVFRGEIELLRYNGERVEVRKNETVEFSTEDRARTYLARGINEEAHDYWDRDREEDRATYARDQKYSRDRYAYGYHDLYRHGRFFEVAGFGWVWRPVHVSFGWDPFLDGSWVYYPGAGYVWVSPYPWGWTPYRYGSWVYIHNYGWCWRRGNTHNTWFNVANIHNPPPNYRRPLPPRPGHTPTGVINVGRGGPNVIVRNPDLIERRPRGDRGQVVDAGTMGGGREGRQPRVITNDNLPSVIANTPPSSPGNAAAGPGTATASPNSGVSSRPGRPDRSDRTDNVPENSGGSIGAERPVRQARDSDYDNVEYRRKPNTGDVTGSTQLEHRDDANRTRPTTGAQPPTTMTTDRPGREARESVVIRTHRPQRAEPRPEVVSRPERTERVSPPAASSPAPQTQIQISRPSAPAPSAPVRTAPPPPPPSSREGRSERPR